MNSLRLSKNLRVIDTRILNRIIDYVRENVHELEIGSIFNILNFTNEIEDNYYVKLYQKIEEDLFSSISQDG